jgi:hypothetical protein
MWITRRCLLALVARELCWRGQGEHPVTGRQIAGVMGVQGADWLNRPEREKEENPEGALDALGIRQGWLWRTSARARVHVAAAGQARGADRQGLRERSSAGDAAAAARECGQGRAHEYRDGAGRGGRSEASAGRMDLVLLVDVYHEFSKPREMIDKIRER